MPVVDLTALPSLLPRHAPVIGLDLGEKTIGVAVSDATRGIASPLETIRRTKFTADITRMFELMDSRNVLRVKDLPIAFWDERMSSMAINRMLIDEADISRARRAEVVDKAAAGWILQGALDRLKNL